MHGDLTDILVTRYQMAKQCNGKRMAPSGVIPSVQMEVIPDDICQEHNIHYLLLATCKKYHNMIDPHVLFFMNCTFDKRNLYYSKILDFRNVNRKYYLPHPQVSVWAMLLEEAMRLQNTFMIEWFLDTWKMNLTGKHYLDAPAPLRYWLKQKGCPVWPRKKDHVIINDGARGILIGIDGEEGIVKIVDNATIRIVPMSSLVAST